MWRMRERADGDLSPGEREVMEHASCSGEYAPLSSICFLFLLSISLFSFVALSIGREREVGEADQSIPSTHPFVLLLVCSFVQ